MKKRYGLVTDYEDKTSKYGNEYRLYHVELFYNDRVVKCPVYDMDIRLQIGQQVLMRKNARGFWEIQISKKPA